MTVNKIWQNQILSYNKKFARKNGKYFTRNTELPPNTAIQDYDAGTFIYVASGAPL